MAESKFERCDEDDPNRCLGSNENGRCTYKAVKKDDGSGYYKYCPRHNHQAAKLYENEKIRNYRLDQHRHRVNEFADNEQVKSLREEIGICRLLLETMFNRCKNDTELIMSSNKIQGLVGDIDKLVNSCHKLEVSTGQLLDVEVLKQISNAIVKIIAEETSPEVSGRIGGRIMESIVGIVDDTQAGLR